MSTRWTLAGGMATIILAALLFAFFGPAGRPTAINIEEGGIVLRLSADGRRVLYGSSMGTIGILDSHDHVEIARATSIRGAVCDIAEFQEGRVFLLQYISESSGFRLCSWHPHSDIAAITEVYRDNDADKYSRPTQLAIVDLPEGPHVICVSAVSGSVSLHRASDGMVVFSGKAIPRIYSYKSNDGTVALLSSDGMTYRISSSGGGKYSGEKAESLGSGYADHRLFGAGAGSEGNGTYALSAVADAPSITNVISLASGRTPVASLYNRRTEDAPSSGVILPNNSIFIAYPNGEILAWRYEQWVSCKVIKKGWR